MTLTKQLTSSNSKSITNVSGLDDLKTQSEIDGAVKEMKKSDHDYSLNILRKLVQFISPIFLLLFNIILFVSYPTTVAKSLL